MESCNEEKKDRRKIYYPRRRKEKKFKREGRNSIKKDFIKKNPNATVIAILDHSIKRQRLSMALKEFLVICYFKRH